MERLQNCWAAASWNEDSSGIDINSILQRDINDSSRDEPEDLFTIATRGISLSAPSTENQEPCVVQLTCQQNFRITTVETISDAKHTEVYTGTNEYSGTVRGQSVKVGEDDPNRADVLYQGEWRFEKPVTQCAVKFLSLKDKHHMKLYRVRVALEQSRECESRHGVGILPNQPTIDMAQVRDLLGAMNHDTDEKSEQLMSSIEEYQKNKSAMYEDIQSLMRDSASPQSTTQTSDPASGALGMLSMFSKLSLLQGKQFGNTAATEASPETDNNEAMFSMMRNICGEVTRMRENSSKRDLTKEEAGSHNIKDTLNEAVAVRDKLAPERTEDSLLQMEERERLMERIEEAERRILEHVDTRISALQSHFDARLDTMMALLAQKIVGNSADPPVD